MKKSSNDSTDSRPNIDRLANEGMIFKNSFCTNSICVPSRAVIKTELHRHLNRVTDNIQVFDSAQTTFPKLIKQGGYQTAVIDKWHLINESIGFDFWKALPGQGKYYNPDFRNPNGTKRIEGYVPDIFTDVSIEWLENGRDKSKPFLLMTQKAPHKSWVPSPGLLTMYDDVDIPEPETLFDHYSDCASGAASQKIETTSDMRYSLDLKVIRSPEDSSGKKHSYFVKQNQSKLK